MNLNRLNVAQNRYQRIEHHKRVLTVCSGGCLRSPTAAVVLAGEPYNFNTRAVGCTEEYAIIPIDEILVAWADEIVFMEAWQHQQVAQQFDLNGVRVVVLDIPDRFAYRDAELIRLIHDSYDNKTGDDDGPF